ncbi:MAG: bifunctional riboflavin kinase/FAD synthetase [Prevotella sp.]|nr:bifunctional riboflavin kinase/FAD synthetase [Prevotella sp.]
METIYLQNTSVTHATPYVATLGFFDGLHLGHQYLVRQVVDRARQVGMQSMVITFDLHPRQVLQQDYQPELLSTLDMKLEQLSLTGVDQVVVLHFDRQLASLSAHDFMAEVLSRQLHVKELIIGYDNRFGHNRQEGFEDYQRYGIALGMTVTQSDAFSLQGIQVSSSVVRRLINEGNLDEANRCMGRPYALDGKIVGGFREGRKMGFPTANLDLSSTHQLIPPHGVYAVRVHIEGYGQTLYGMTNIGIRPTFGGLNLTVETYIFDFSGDIYDRRIRLDFIRRVREERKFSGPEELSAQLKKDEAHIRQLFKATI